MSRGGVVDRANAGYEEENAAEKDAYYEGLAEGFRRGVEAAADLVSETIGNRHFLEEAIRALRPEGEK